MKMKTKISTLICVLAALWCAGCGAVFNDAIDDITLRQSSWFTILGGTGWEIAYSAHQTSDGGYIIAGYCNEAIDPLQGKHPITAYYNDGNYDMLIVKLDAGGNVAWYTFLGGAGNERTESIAPTSDGGCIVAGYSYYDITFDQGTKINAHHASGTNNDLLIVKLDANGNISWYTFLGGATGSETVNDIQQTSDGGYIVAGGGTGTINPDEMQNAPCRNDYSGSNTDMLVVKLDSSGNAAWYTFLGDTGNDQAQSIRQTSDGGYIIGGQSNAMIGTEKMQNAPCRNAYSGGSDMLAVKLDSSGNVAWYTFLGSAAGTDKANSIDQASDGGYIVAGVANATIDTLQGKWPINSFGGGTNNDMLVVKLDYSGNVSWYTFLGGAGIEQALSMQHTSDGGCIVAGYTSTNITLPQGTKLGAYSGSHDMLVVNLDSGGMVSWYTLLGGTGQDQAQSIEQTSDGGYIVAGNTAANIPLLQGKEPINSFAGGTYDMLIVKLKNDGTL